MDELKKNVFIRVKLDDAQNIVHFDFIDKNGEKIIEKTDDKDRIFEKINTNAESKLDSKYIIVSADVTETIDDDGNFKYNLDNIQNLNELKKPDIKDDLAPGFYILDDMLTQEVLEEKEDDLKTPEEKKQSSFRQFFEKIYNSLNLFGWIRNRNNKNPDKKINIPSDLLFENNKEIGKGKFASVELWEDKKNQQNKYAVKILNYGKEQTNNTFNDIKKEIYILQKLKESNKNRCIYNILCFKGAYHDIKNEIIYIATEYDENYNTLDTVLNHAKDLEQYAVIKILSLLFEAILDFHALNICHNDIKPDNILCSKNIAEIPKINIKVIDFGFACLKDDTYAKCDVTKILGTYEYIDPSKEYYNIPDVTPKDNYNQNYIKCDYWSVGIIFKNFIDKAELNFEINKTENFRNRFGKIFYLYYKTIIGKRMLDTEDENEDEKEDESDMIIVNEFKDIFNQLIPISDKWFDYAIENEMTFARIEDLLDPDLSQRYIFTEEDMRILKAAKTTKGISLEYLVNSIYNYDSSRLLKQINKDENRKAKLELEITRITNKIV